MTSGTLLFSVQDSDGPLRLNSGSTFHTTNGFTFGGHVNVPTGKVLKINGTEILSATTLGSGITGSSLTSVGTLSSLTLGGDINLGNNNITNGGTVTATSFVGALTGNASTVTNGIYTTSSVTALSDVTSVGSGAIITSAERTKLTNLDAAADATNTASVLAAGAVMATGTTNQTIGGVKTFSSTIVGSVDGNAGTVTNGVYTTGNQSIGGTKTFTSTISGSIDGNAATVTDGVYASTNQTISGTKTFSALIGGSINGNAATVTNGVYTTGSQSIAGAKTFTSTIVGSITGNADTVTNGVYMTGNQTIGGDKTFSSDIIGSITGNAATVTNGVYTTGNQTIGGTKTFSNTISGSIDGNAGTVTNGVYTTGAQTIAGNKTFSNDVTINGTLTATISGGAASAQTVSVAEVSNNADYFPTFVASNSGNQALKLDTNLKFNPSTDTLSVPNLTVTGTTTTVNSTVVTIADPILQLGQSGTDDNLDRGLVLLYNDGSAKKAFIGYDDSDGKFMVLTDATDTSNVFTGTAGTLKANIEGNVTGNASSATTVTNGVYTTSSVTALSDVSSAGSGAIITTAERNKLNAIEAAADVTDATNVTAAGAVMTSGNQTIAGTKTFSGTISGNITGNAGTVTNGIYTTSSITAISDVSSAGSGSIITTAERNKLAAIEASADVTDATNVAAAGAVMKTGNETVAGNKTFSSNIIGNITGNAATVTNGVYTTSSVTVLSDVTSVGSGAIITAAERTKLNGIEAGADVTDATNVEAAGAVMNTGNETIAGTKTFSNTIVGSINGNAATVTNGVYTTNSVTVLNDVTSAGSGAIITAAERTKLNGIETAADVTDATNVQAAGAVMTGNVNQSISGTKTFNNAIVGSVTGNAATVTNGIYTTSSVTALSDVTSVGSGAIITGAERTKLAAIEENADVTDATNVAAAGAVMNTGNETIAGTKTFSSTITGSIDGNAATTTVALGSANADHFVTFVDATTGSKASLTHGNLKYNPSSDTLSVPNLTVSGNTQTVNSSTVTITNPIYTIGDDSTDDNLDRGILMKYKTGVNTKKAFMGYDDSDGKFIMIPDATENSSVISGTKGTLKANLEGNADTVTNGIYTTSSVTALSDVTSVGSGAIITAAERTKLAGIEAAADVTDATNVAAAGGVLNTGNETIAGTKTFSSAIAGSITGNAATVTNGVYTTSSVTALSDVTNAGSGEIITDAERTKLSGIEAAADVTDATNVLAAGGVMTSGNQTIAGTKTFSSPIAASVTGNAATVTNGVYTGNSVTVLSDVNSAGSGAIITDAERTKLIGIETSADVTDATNVLAAGGVMTSGNQTIGGTKTFSNAISGNISGNAATVTNGVYTTSSVTALSDVTSVGSGAIITAAERTKLAGIEASADVTDATNVAAAGAVMNTGNETIAGTKTFSAAIAGDITGNAATITTTASTANAEEYVVFVSAANSGQSAKLNTNLKYNPSTGTLSVPNMTVTGTQSITNSNTVTITNPIFTLGDDTNDDNLDRGILMNYKQGSTAKKAFMGYDDSDGKFVVIPDATNNSGVLAGSAGILKADLEGNADTVTNGIYTTSSVTALSDVSNAGSGAIITNAERTKLSGIETGADVTDATNVAAAGGVLNTGNETIAGTKTFSSTISGNISGNAGTVTNGIYTTSSVTAISDVTHAGSGAIITDAERTKLNGIETAADVTDATNVAAAGGVMVTGNQTISGTKTFSSAIAGSITGNAGTVTNGVYTTSSVTALNDVTNAGSGAIITGAERTKLSGIETAADVTDATNVLAAGGVMTSGNQTIAGTKTFSSTIAGSVTGNAGTVTNGLYTTSSVTALSDITSAGSGAIITGAERTKLSGIEASADVTDATNVLAAGGVMTSGNQAISGTKTFSSTIAGSVTGNAGTVTNGIYTSSSVTELNDVTSAGSGAIITTAERNKLAALSTGADVTNAASVAAAGGVLNTGNETIAGTKTFSSTISGSVDGNARSLTLASSSYNSSQYPTFVSGTSTIVFAITAAGGKYYIDGSVNPVLELSEGSTYKFDLSNASNNNHPLKFSTTSDGTHNSGSEYTTGVTTNGTAGSSGAWVQIVINASSPTLYYYCGNHSGMGNQINTPPQFKYNSAMHFNPSTNTLFVPNITISGTTQTVNSSSTTITNPIYTIGEDTTDDNLDRGIRMKYNSAGAKSAFMGYDDSDGKFMMIPNATISGSIVSGTVGILKANLEGNVTGNADTVTNGVYTTNSVTALSDVTDAGSGAIITAAERTKLNGIETGADVTDGTNVLAAGAVMITGNQTISDSKTFSSTITGSITGNAGTVTNGIYTTSSVSDLSDVTSVGSGAIITDSERTKLSGIEALADVTDATNVLAAGGVMTDGNQIIAGSKTFSSTIGGNISGNAATVTNGVYTTSSVVSLNDVTDAGSGRIITDAERTKLANMPDEVLSVTETNVTDAGAVMRTGNQTISGTKTFSDTISGNISGNAATVTNGVYTTSSVTSLTDVTNSGSGKIITDVERTKLTSIEENADVTDFTNVLAAGGVMNTGNQNVAGIKTFTNTISGSINGNAETVTNGIYTTSSVTALSDVTGVGSGSIITTAERNKLSGIELLADKTDATNVSAAGAVMNTGNETVLGVKTFSSAIAGSITGNAGTITVAPDTTNADRFVAIVGDKTGSQSVMVNTNLKYNPSTQTMFVPNLTVTGNTQTVSSTSTTITNPVYTIGEDTTDDNLDRGILMKYNNGSAKKAFMGWDDSAAKFVMIPDASVSGNVFSGAVGTLKANLEGNADTVTNGVYSTDSVTALSDVSSAGSGAIITNAERTKLNGIEASADVTDATNVAAAGAVMNTGNETINGTKTFASTVQASITGNAGTVTNGLYTSSSVTALTDVSSAGSGAIITNAERTKLNGIEASADVTDAANVAAAGAVMNTGNEIIAGTKTFSSAIAGSITGNAATVTNGVYTTSSVTALTDITSAGSGSIITAAERTKLNGIETSADVTDATNVSAAGAMMKTGNETVAGTKTFSSAIAGSITGNAATVTNGVYTTSSVTALSDVTSVGSGAIITAAERTKLAGIEAAADVTDATNVAAAGGVLNSGNETIAGVKTFSNTIVGSINGNAGTVTATSDNTDADRYITFVNGTSGAQAVGLKSNLKFNPNSDTLSVPNLTVTGTQTTVNSTTVTITNPIYTLGGDGSDDNLDRGILMKYNNSGAKKAFMGYDDSDGKFVMIPDATNTGGVISGTKGTLKANIEGNASTVTNGVYTTSNVTALNDVTSAGSGAIITGAERSKLNAIEAAADVTDAANVAAAGGVLNTGNETVAGVKTFSSTIVGSINGNAATVTNGVYTTSSVTALSDVSSAGSGAIITNAERTKLNGIEASADVTDATNVAAAGGVMNTGNETIAGIKTFSSNIAGSITGNAATVTNGVYTTSSVTALSDVTSVGSGAIITAAERTKLAGIETSADVTDAANVAAAGAVMNTGAETIAGSKTFSSTILGSINGNAATVTNGIYTSSSVTALSDVTSVGSGAIITAAERTKLSGIETAADVTDATNVAAAGAVMNTGNETIAGTKTFSSAIAGDITGNSATSTVTADNTNADQYPTFVPSSSTASQGLRHNANLKFNPSTQTLTVPNLSVTGTTQTVSSSTVTITNPVYTIGEDTTDDNLDRGILMKYNNGSAKKAFMGYDDSDGKFVMIPDATDTSNVFSGAVGTLKANLEGNVTGNATTVTNGVYTTSSVTALNDVTSAGSGAIITTAERSKLAGVEELADKTDGTNVLAAGAVMDSGDQTVAGSKTFSNTILGNINGNAATVTNGVYTTNSVTVLNDVTNAGSGAIITAAERTKLEGIANGANVTNSTTVKAAGAVMNTGDEIVNGTKTFSNTIAGSINGNAATVTNGVYTTSSVTALSDVTSAGSGKIITDGERTKLAGITTGADATTGSTVEAAGGVLITGNQTIAGTKTFSSTIGGNITGNAGTVTNGVYTNNSVTVLSDVTDAGSGAIITTAERNKLNAIEAGANVTDAANVSAAGAMMKTGNETVAGTKTFSSAIAGSITGNAATVTNGVYTTSSVTALSDVTNAGSGLIITTAERNKLNAIEAAADVTDATNVSAAGAMMKTGDETVAGTKTFSSTITGSVSGNAGTVTTAAGSTNADHYVSFSSGATGAQAILTDGNLKYNPSSNTLSVPNITVSGTQTITNSNTVTISNPIYTIGTDGTDDNLDRGILMRYNNGVSAKKAFMGYDDSDGKFIMIPDATDTNNVISGTKGTLKANLEGNAATVTNGVYTTSSATALSDISSAGSGAIITAAERTKLSGIETAADVTDATNVAAAGAVMNTGDETISGTKTFNNTITGSITGNAATVTNGVYTTNSVTVLNDVSSAGSGAIITNAERTKLNGIETSADVTDAANVTAAGAVMTSGNQTVGGTKTFSSTIVGSINGNAATVTNGIYTTSNVTALSDVTSAGSGAIITNAERTKLNGIEALADVTDTTNVSAAGAVMNSGNQTVSGTKTFSSTIVANISGNAATVTNGVYTGSSVTALSDVTSAGSGVIITAVERTKLNGIEALADVTDATNVSAAGAMMKTGDETVAGNKTFSNDIIASITGNAETTTVAAVTTDADFFCMLSAGTSGAQAHKVNTNLKYNPSTGTMSIPNLTVTGTTTTVNSNSTTITNPIYTLGEDTSDDNLDRGILMKYHNGTAAKKAFMGYDDSDGKFVVIPDATNSSNVISGTKGTLKANIEGNLTGNADTVTNGVYTTSNVTALADVTSAGSGAIITNAERTKLNGIETAADVTDAANVTAAGAVMTTGAQNVAGVKTFSSTISGNISGNAGTVTNGVYTTSSVTALSDVTNAGSGAIITAAERTKLNGLTTGADATTFATVEAAGGVMTTTNQTVAGTKTFSNTIVGSINGNAATVTNGIYTTSNVTALADVTSAGSGAIITNAERTKLNGISTGADVTNAASVEAAGAVMNSGNETIAGIKTFSSTISGNITGSAGSCTNTTNIAISSSTTNAQFFPTFVSSTSGNNPLKVGSNLKYNPNTETLSIPNLTVTGTTTTVNSTTVTVADPILQLGANGSDDNLDRGIVMLYNDGAAKKAFMGYDDSDGKFAMLTTATDTSNVFTGTKATLKANIEGNLTGNVNGIIGGTTPAAVTGTTITANSGFVGNLTGDVTGTVSTATSAGTVSSSSQPNITTLGGVTSIGSSGSTVVIAGDFTVTGTNNSAAGNVSIWAEPWKLSTQSLYSTIFSAATTASTTFYHGIMLQDTGTYKNLKFRTSDNLSTHTFTVTVSLHAAASGPQPNTTAAFSASNVVINNGANDKHDTIFTATFNSPTQLTRGTFYYIGITWTASAGSATFGLQGTELVGDVASNKLLWKKPSGGSLSADGGAAYWFAFYGDQVSNSGGGAGGNPTITTSTTNSDHYPTFVSASSGTPNQQVNTSIKLNPSTGTLTVPQIAGTNNSGINSNYGSANSVVFSGNLLPATHNAFDIGNASVKVRDIYEHDSSDFALKQDISDYTGGLSFVNGLRPVNFTWKPEYHHGGKQQTGLIAQEVKQTMESHPDYKSFRLWSNDSESQGLDTKQLIPVLVSAIKQLSEKVSQLESTLAAQD